VSLKALRARSGVRENSSVCLTFSVSPPPDFPPSLLRHFLNSESRWGESWPGGSVKNKKANAQPALHAYKVIRRLPYLSLALFGKVTCFGCFQVPPSVPLFSTFLIRVTRTKLRRLPQHGLDHEARRGGVGECAPDL
jgi:hypothetical protein